MRRRNVPCSPCGSGSSDCGCCPPKSIKKINNIEPDDNGKFEVRAGTNVTITDITNGIEIASAGSVEDVVKTVNGVSPDADGDFTITAGSTNITITATVNGVEIDASIPDKEWHAVNDNQWARFRDANNKAVTDLLINIYNSNYPYAGDLYIPKGMDVTRFAIDIQEHLSTRLALYNINAGTILGNGSSVYVYGSYVSIQESGSGIDAIATIAIGSTNINLSRNSIAGAMLYVTEDVI